MIYIYDNSFLGLLTAIFYIYFNKDFNCNLMAEKFFCNNTFFTVKEVPTEGDKALRVCDGLIKNISRDFLREVYYLYLADTSNSSNIALRYVIDGLKYGNNIYRCLHLQSANDAFKLKNKILLENHRFKGLVRFKVVKDIYFSDINPDYNILPILYSHFEARLPVQNWIIHDTKRKYAAIHIDESTQLAEYDDSGINTEGDIYEDIWCEFFKAVAIKERTNPKQQKNFMPKRYWEGIVETKV